MNTANNGTPQERARLFDKGRLLFDSCDADDFACVFGYLDHTRALGGWRAEVIRDFVQWLEKQASRDDEIGNRATALLDELIKDNSSS